MAYKKYKDIRIVPLRIREYTDISTHFYCCYGHYQLINKSLVLLYPLSLGRVHFLVMSGDARKDYLLATIGNHFGYSVSDGSVAHIPTSPEMNSFLDDGNCSLLAARQELTGGVELIQVKKK